MEPIPACPRRDRLDELTGVDKQIHDMFTVAASVHAKAVAANNSRLALLDVQECDRLLDLWLSRHPDRINDGAPDGAERPERATPLQTPS